MLIPAKDLHSGQVAIQHGADALYIGAPRFGARQAAGNSLQDLDQLIQYAHLYGSKVHVTVNTLLFDNELEDARKLIWRCADYSGFGYLEDGSPAYCTSCQYPMP